MAMHAGLNLVLPSPQLQSNATSAQLNAIPQHSFIGLLQQQPHQQHVTGKHPTWHAAGAGSPRAKKRRHAEMASAGCQPGPSQQAKDMKPRKRLASTALNSDARPSVQADDEMQRKMVPAFLYHAVSLICIYNSR